MRGGFGQFFKHCCTTFQICQVVVDGLFGQSAKRPAENTWTYLEAEMSNCLLRRVVFNIGPRSFIPAELKKGENSQIEVDGEATDNHLARMMNIRETHAAVYLNNDEHFGELVVLLGIIRALNGNSLYPLLVDRASRDSRADEEEESVLDKLLHPEEGLLAKALEDLLALLIEWPEPDGDTNWDQVYNQRWRLFELVGINPQEEKFKRWTRSQVLRANSSIQRRLEELLADWSFKLYAVAREELFEDSVVDAIIDELLSSIRGDLDIYAFGVRQHHPTKERLHRTDCKVMLRTDFRTFKYTTRGAGHGYGGV